MRNKIFAYPFIAVALWTYDIMAVGDNKAVEKKSGVNAEKSSIGAERANIDDDLQQLSDPERKVTGAYYGLGFGISKISNSVQIKHGNNEQRYKKSANQGDISLIVGFGSRFYERYYAGVELDFFKRLNKKTQRFNFDGRDVGIIHNASMGMNMDVRFGLQLPEHGSLVYVTVGFARITGNTEFYNLDANSTYKKSFGSFYPTVGSGVEYKLNHQWNIRGDFRFSITSRDRHSVVFRDNIGDWSAAGKPNRVAFRISVTRSI